MPRRKLETLEEEVVIDQGITEIGETFGNGDLNLLKEKINELVRKING